MVLKPLIPVRGMRGSLRVFHYLRPTSLSRRLGFRRLNCPNPWRRFADTTEGSRSEVQACRGLRTATHYKRAYMKCLLLLMGLFLDRQVHFPLRGLGQEPRHLLRPLLELGPLRHLADLGFERLQIRGVLLKDHIRGSQRGEM